MQLELNLPDEAPRVIERVSARARQIRIELRADGSVLLVYPRWLPRREALAFLHSRADWLREQRAAQDAAAAASPFTTPRWHNADRIPLRGELLPLRIEPARLRRPAVRFDRGQISVFVDPAQRGNTPVLETVLRAALQQQARSDARRLLDAESARLGLRYTQLRICDPRRQWGSCTAAAVVSLSWRLVMAPPEVFRYVVVHELCHLVHMDHSPRFWALVERQLPAYAAHKEWLRHEGVHLQRVLPPKAGA